MKAYIPLIAFFALTLPAPADPTEEERAFLKVEGADKEMTGCDRQTFQKADLPKGVVAVLARIDWGAGDGSVPASLSGYTIDLNKDRRNEYFIETGRGGSGGPAFIVLTEAGNTWVAVMQFQGGFHIMPVKDGWPRIVTTSRGGGGNFTKMHFEHDGRTYRANVREGYSRGKVTRTVIAPGSD